MKVLVTGAAGFIGSNVAEKLARRGDHVVGLDNFNDYYEPAKKRANEKRLKAYPNFTMIEADIRDRARIFAIFVEEKIDVVAHLAAKCGLSENAIESALNELVELAIQETNAHDAFSIPGMGTMVKLVREERMGRNPQTGEPVLIPAKTVVKFRLDYQLKARCGDRSAEPAGS